MSELFPRTPKRIRERIRRYERALEKELKTGDGGDGYGKRFLLGPLYMLLGDVEGALSPSYCGGFSTRVPVRGLDALVRQGLFGES